MFVKLAGRHLTDESRKRRERKLMRTVERIGREADIYGLCYWPPVQLTLARLRELTREPEALFWVYGFPILMTLALGIAFRNQPVEQIVVDIVAGPAAEATAKQLRQSRTSPERFKTQVLPEAEAAHAAAHRADRPGGGRRCAATDADGSAAVRVPLRSHAAAERARAERGRRSVAAGGGPAATWPK